MKEDKTMESKENQIAAIKGFDADLRCRDFQFEVGKTYKHKGKVELCRSGFHAVSESPFDVWSYYGPIDSDGRLSRYADVTLSGVVEDKGSGDSKVAAATITIEAELSLPQLLQCGIDWLLKNAHKKESGYNAQMAASGDRAQMAASGDRAQMAASGYDAQMAASGDRAQMAASGGYAKMAASGNYAQMAASGDRAQMAASGYDAQMAASGNYAQMAASGNYAQMAASGDRAQMAASGKDAVIASAGRNTIASGIVGTHIALAEYDGAGKCIGFAIGCIGENGLLPNTQYKAKGGKLVPAGGK